MHGTVAAVARAAEERPAHRARRPLRRPRHRQGSTRSRPDAKVIHADIDPAEISKNRTADVPDRRRLPRGHRRPRRRAAGRAVDGRPAADYAAWWRYLDATARRRTRSATREPADGVLAPQYVIERLGEIAGPEAIYAAGVGQHQMWAAQFIKYEKPDTWLNSGGARDDGLRRAGRDGRQGRPPGRDRVGDRRRRLLPDDQPGARHLRDQRHPDQGRDHQQRQPRHGAAVADAVLRRPLLQHRPALASASPTS